MHRHFRHSVIALALLGSAGVALAQEKSQQNTADEALTNRSPSQGTPQGNQSQQDAKPQSGAGPMAIPGNQALGNDPVLQDGKLAVPGASQQTQDTPAKYSAKNAADDKTPIMAWPLPLTDQQRREIYERLGRTQAPVLAANVKPADEIDNWTAFQDLPADLTDKIPFVNGYKFVKLADKILLVNPRERIVVDEITQ
jgi:hypothetical protein